MGDLISRQAAIDALDCINGTEEVLRSLPSAQSKRKTGRWIDGQCSNCGCDIPAYIIDWKWQKDMDANFCPNCGSPMEKEGEE